MLVHSPIPDPELISAWAFVEPGGVFYSPPASPLVWWDRADRRGRWAKLPSFPGACEKELAGEESPLLLLIPGDSPG